MKMLELFSGTGSVGDVAKDLGFEDLSLDRDMEADVKMDIMDWDYKTIPPNTFDFIWASPPCTEYSRAKTVGVRDIEGSNIVVQRTLDIIDYFNPRYFILENPQTGLLKDQEMMRQIPYNDIDYCKYGMPYRKRTRLWNNINRLTWLPRPLCNKDCGSMNEGGKRHMQTAQRGTKVGDTDDRTFKQSELYRIPRGLVEEILGSIAGVGVG